LSEFHGAEVEIPEPIIDLFEADVLFAENMTDVDPGTVPTDAAVTADEPDFEVAGIIDRRDPSRERSRGGLIDRGRGFLPERFVRPLFVEGLPKSIERSLLSRAGGSCRPGGFGLQRSVHAFMTAILLGRGRLGELGTDTEPDPPDGQLGEPSESGRGERGAVVGADELRQTVLPEESLENGLRSCVRWMQQSLAAEQVARESIGDRQWIAVGAVTSPELALEVCGPDEIGGGHHGHGAAGVAEATTTARGLHQAVTLEQIADRASSRWREFRATVLQNRQELLGAPGRMASPDLEERVDDISRNRVRARARTSRPLEKSDGTISHVAGEPLVGGLPTDPEAIAQLHDAASMLQELGDKLKALVHG